MRYIPVRTELTADLSQLMGGHVQLLRQVLMNLIDAMKYVNGVRELAIKSQRAEDKQPLVSASDTNVGLPPQEAGQIFDPFFTTEANDTRIGLRISSSIIESSGGRLWALPSSFLGANFCFVLSANDQAPQ